MSFTLEELAQTELFRGVPENMINLALKNATPLELAKGEVLLSPECENHFLYLLLSGSFAVHFDSIKSPEIRELTKGVSVGEMSIIDGTRPSAFVIAKEPSKVLPIHRDVLQGLLAETSPIASNLLRMLTPWLKANTQRIVQDRQQIWELTDHANIDALTGLYNRRWMDNSLSRLLEQSIVGGQQLCILLIDVDHFKKYNDTQGHPGGDQALLAMGEVLKATVRPYEFASRYGGEEFMVMLPNTNKDGGIVTAERIRLAAEKKAIISPEGNQLPSITISIGIAVSDPHSTPQTLIAAADAQLYRAKEEGRNCVRY